ncbi:hypothetical protein PRCB_03540 [Pantoea rodasii]|uniref:Uncharacterized protein n=1 Tax=Pantoea rodasii TaxID=1076549 RepID=A0A2M9WI07_9GAMM|nr:hypothetical protein [Pantoea rodasii]PJZ07098.1 hypothetical protein PRCB_03540 [Pantoea rodasii]
MNVPVVARLIAQATAWHAMKRHRQIDLQPEAIVKALSWAINQPGEIDANEITVRPTASGHGGKISLAISG